MKMGSTATVQSTVQSGEGAAVPSLLSTLFFVVADWTFLFYGQMNVDEQRNRGQP